MKGLLLSSYVYILSSVLSFGQETIEPGNETSTNVFYETTFPNHSMLSYQVCSPQYWLSPDEFPPTGSTNANLIGRLNYSQPIARR